MENSFQTSFIPKKLITSNISDKEPKNFFSLIATFLLIISILISAGLYVYKIYLTKQEETLSLSLEKTRNSFEQDTIDELELFNKRTQSAKTILNNHIVLSPMFTLLGEITIPSIQYTSFTQDTTSDQTFGVTIKGVAQDYRSIALQADVFNSIKGSSFKNVLFSNLSKDKNNNIDFSLNFNVDPNLLSYEKNSLLVSTSDSNTTTTQPPTNLGNQTQ
jgi:hypothetical protein